MMENSDHKPSRIFPAAHGLWQRPDLYVFIFVCLALLAAMPVIKQMDYVWTLALHRHQVRWLTQIMGQTLFEGHPPGASDVPVLFLGISVILYTIAWLRPQHAGLVRLRPYLGFIVSVGFINGVLMVHGPKLALGRARPGLVFGHGAAYSPFYAFGPHYITEDFFRGSFPSGHTASMFTLMAIAYILMFDSHRWARAHLAGMFWAALVLAVSVLMAVARSMSMSHWIGDGLLIILISWLVLHALYFWILKVPLQANQPSAVQMPPLWELRLCWWLGWMTMGLLATVLGARAFEQQIPWLGVLIPGGLLLLVFAIRRFQHVYRRVRVVFAHLESRALDGVGCDNRNRNRDRNRKDMADSS
jgi:PAP2 superfamily